MEWNEERGDNGKEYTSTEERKTVQIQTQRQDHMCVAETLYTTTR